jgi:hypothetical protein
LPELKAPINKGLFIFYPYIRNQQAGGSSPLISFSKNPLNKGFLVVAIPRRPQNNKTSDRTDEAAEALGNRIFKCCH